MKAEPFDPAPLVTAARAQHPDAPWLAEALGRCTAVYPEGKVYLRVLAPGTDLRVVETWMVYDRKLGEVVVDVVAGRRIGGLEFLKQL